jgi:hypothetical protein
MLFKSDLGFRFCPGLQLNNYDDAKQPTLSGYKKYILAMILANMRIAIK